jgi:hypothetical protein
LKNITRDIREHNLAGPIIGDDLDRLLALAWGGQDKKKTAKGIKREG